MDKELEEAKKWVEGRIKYIAENCDLCDTDNARAFNNFKTILQVLENSISKQAVVNETIEIIKTTSPTPIFKPERFWNIGDYERLYKTQPLYKLLKGK